MYMNNIHVKLYSVDVYVHVYVNVFVYVFVFLNVFLMHVYVMYGQTRHK